MQRIFSSFRGKEEVTAAIPVLFINLFLRLYEMAVSISLYLCAATLTLASLRVRNRDRSAASSRCILNIYLYLHTALFCTFASRFYEL